MIDRSHFVGIIYANFQFYSCLNTYFYRHRPKTAKSCKRLMNLESKSIKIFMMSLLLHMDIGATWATNNSLLSCDWQLAMCTFICSWDSTYITYLDGFSLFSFIWKIIAAKKGYNEVCMFSLDFECVVSVIHSFSSARKKFARSGELVAYDLRKRSDRWLWNNLVNALSCWQWPFVMQHLLSWRAFVVSSLANFLPTCNGNTRESKFEMGATVNASSNKGVRNSSQANHLFSVECDRSDLMC